jgi:hypothetical protein
MQGDPFFDVTAALRAWPDRAAVQHFQGKWTDKHWMNTPGPIYCGDCDNSGTGPLEAPNNVQMDPKGYEVIYRQPVNPYELGQTLGAAWADPGHGYAMDGDAHWSYFAVRAWWVEKRPEVERALAHEYESFRQKRNESRLDYAYFAGVRRWQAYMRDGLRDYLRAYAFFLEMGRAPGARDALPEM